MNMLASHDPLKTPASEPTSLRITVKSPQDTLKILDGIRKYDLLLLEHPGKVELPEAGAKTPLAVKLMLKMLFAKEHFLFISKAAETAATLLMGSGVAEAKDGVSLGADLTAGVELVATKSSQLHGKNINAFVLADACRTAAGKIDAETLQKFFSALAATNKMKTAALLSIGESVDPAVVKTLAAQGVTVIEVNSQGIAELYQAALRSK
ncbi:MAG: hypothetical protein K1X83_12175 [Oligoflexia bacterium]|nr:hypothetical protein [Oligoflexia bacterium]